MKTESSYISFQWWMMGIGKFCIARRSAGKKLVRQRVPLAKQIRRGRGVKDGMRIIPSTSRPVDDVNSAEDNNNCID